MGQIIALDENMVNMIAAGEVIERPASIVKELLENSIDAGATKVLVSIEDGGRKLISVADNGWGMDAEDLAMAFESHATSKIKTSEDLAHISTMGFRGEALASIASVAQVKAVSRTKDSLEAACVEVDCGRKSPPRPAGGDAGTTVEVRNLFYKLPGRRKFLRTANTEMTHIIEQFTRIGLAQCEGVGPPPRLASRDAGAGICSPSQMAGSVDMTLLHNGRELYRLLPGQNLRDRIGQLFSRQIAEDLIETQSEEKGLRVFALLGRPDCARATSKFQYVFLNGRCIRDRFISHAVKEAYHGLIEPNKFPVVFLFLQMPYQAYDVNVHPAKLEVRFDNPNLVHSQVLAVLREKLLGMNLDVKAQIPPARATLAENHKDSEAEEIRRRRITEAMAEFFKQHAPLQTQQQLGFSPPGTAGSTPRGAAMQTVQESQRCPPEAVGKGFYQEGQTAQAPPGPQLQPKYFQLHNSYIVAQTQDGFIVIDQHALHERIIYENLCRRISQDKLESQRLVFPESFELTEAQVDALKTSAGLIEKLGIEIEPFGPKTVAIQAFPALLDAVSPLEFVRELLDLLIEKALSLDTERLLHHVLDMAACKAAIKAGQKLSNDEIQGLLAERDSLERVVKQARLGTLSRCPHGRPTTIRFSLADLEKQFKRT